jgi:hypothetical protein
VGQLSARRSSADLNPHVDFALRLGVGSSGFERVVMLLAPASLEADIVALGAAFLGFNAIVPDSVAVPEERGEHDRIAGRFPPVRARVHQDAYPREQRGVRLIDDMRLAPALASLLDLALTRGWEFLPTNATLPATTPMPKS